MLASNPIKPLNEEKTEQKLLQRLLQLKLKKLLSIKLIQSKNNKICFQKGKNLWIHTIQVSKIQSISKFYTHL